MGTKWPLQHLSKSASESGSKLASKSFYNFPEPCPNGLAFQKNNFFDCQGPSWGSVFLGLLVSGSVVSKLFATPWTIAHQAPLSIGFPRQEYNNGSAFSSPEDFPDPGLKPRSPPLQPDVTDWAILTGRYSQTLFRNWLKRCVFPLTVLTFPFLPNTWHCQSLSSYNWAGPCRAFPVINHPLPNPHQGTPLFVEKFLVLDLPWVSKNKFN